MAKNPVFDICMFCDQTPCICKKKVKPAPKPRKKAEPKVAPVGEPVAPAPVADSSFMDAPAVPAPPPKADPFAAMKAAAARSQAAPVALPSERTRPPGAEAAVQPENVDLVTTAAILALEPVLHPASRREYRKVLMQRVTPADRAQMWRDRRNQ